MTSETVNAAIVGISGYGHSYLDVLLDDAAAGARGVRLVAAVDPAPDRSKRLPELRQRGIPVFPSLRSMLDANTGARLVMLVTPIHLHAQQTCLALQHGCAVLCEKPLAGSLTDAWRMFACERKAIEARPGTPGRGDGFRPFVAVGYQWSFSQAVGELKRDIAGGVFGAPRRLKTIVSFPRGFTYFNRNDWAGRLRTASGEDVLDSPVNNATAHYLHNMLYLLGERRTLSAAPASIQAELYRANDIETYDTAALRCVTRSGVEVLFYTTHATADRAGPHSLFEFERATVVYDDSGLGQFVARFHDGTLKAYGNPNRDRHEKIWQSAEAVRSGEPVACGIAAALPQTVCVVGAQRSMPRAAVFPSSIIRKVDLGDDTMLEVRGLYETLTDCYDRGVLPSELGGVAWAQPGETIDVSEELSPLAETPAVDAAAIAPVAAAPVSAVAGTIQA